MSKYINVSYTHRQQGGMALIVCLIMLLLLTMVGVSSMQNATLQEKMAGSVKFRNESFQNAEAALRVGENAVAVSTFNQDVCSNFASTDCEPPASSLTQTTAGTSGGVTWIATGTSLYAVQKIGSTATPVNAPQKCEGGAVLYRITAIGFSGTSRSVVESIYAKC